MNKEIEVQVSDTTMLRRDIMLTIKNLKTSLRIKGKKLGGIVVEKYFCKH